MIEVRKIAQEPELHVGSFPITCYVCGQTADSDPNIKRLAFGKADKLSASICLCSGCSKNLQGMLSLM